VEARFAAAFLIGLPGGVHCVGMGGGIVRALLDGFVCRGPGRAADPGEHIRQGLLCII